VLEWPDVVAIEETVALGQEVGRILKLNLQEARQ
jgi:hypothetical protein